MEIDEIMIDGVRIKLSIEHETNIHKLQIDITRELIKDLGACGLKDVIMDKISKALDTLIIRGGL